jgi:hypothetical protein
VEDSTAFFSAENAARRHAPPYHQTPLSYDPAQRTLSLTTAEGVRLTSSCVAFGEELQKNPSRAFVNFVGDSKEARDLRRRFQQYALTWTGGGGGGEGGVPTKTWLPAYPVEMEAGSLLFGWSKSHHAAVAHSSPNPNQ